MIFTTQKAALCHALLNGETLSIMDGFKRFGITNLPREIGRLIERGFGVMILRQEEQNKTSFGTTSNYMSYKLLFPKNGRTDSAVFLEAGHSSKMQSEGISKMQKYVDDHTQPDTNPPFKCKVHCPEGGLSISAHYARTAEKRAITRNGKSTQEIIIESIKKMEVPENKKAAHYAKEAAKDVVTRSGKSTEQLVKESLYTRKELDKIKKKLKNKKK